MAKRKVCLVQQGVWRSKAADRLPPMPLACGYLKAAVECDPRLRDEVDVTIVSLPGGETTVDVLRRLLFDQLPDLLGFSVLGWNQDLFGRVADVFRSMSPTGWVLFGGTHVANQAERVFRVLPSVDVVVNGEGEWVFLELLRAWLGGTSPRELQQVRGISFHAEDGTVVTTEPVGRIQDLDKLPSPFLTGALQLTDDRGRFRYENALLETNRGCPYRCSFCYWGGAIGQKVRAFSLDRLREEVDLLARAGAEQIVLCDANFGILHRDEEFIEICIRAREQHGYPRTIMTSWAKDKRKTFYNVVSRMRDAGFHSSFNLALQSLSEGALETMQRRNMRINEWKDLADWLHAQGMAVYGELIWGCPGETCESFLEGYDELARHVTRIATYPLLLLPNTAYVERKEELQLVTWRTNTDDFERVLSHHSMTIAENRRMHGFLFWARVICEHLLLRYIWKPLADCASVTQSRVLLALDEWVLAQTDDAARRLRSCRDRAFNELDLSSDCIERGLQFFFSDPESDELMRRWWREAIGPRVPAECRAVLQDIFHFDWLSRPIYAVEDVDLPREQRDGVPHYVRRHESFDHDVPEALRTFSATGLLDRSRRPTLLDFYYRVGFCNNMALYHNAQNELYFGVAQASSERSVAPAVPALEGQLSH
jgi:radical SAM superfamily enzyme YgiQ (UPF0313 family)